MVCMVEYSVLCGLFRAEGVLLGLYLPSASGPLCLCIHTTLTYSHNHPLCHLTPPLIQSPLAHTSKPKHKQVNTPV